uniref:hypothetical protein n=1 Tax=Ndongobacter massiliensis TaxID=1871025 RepID=UPI000931DD1C|nr:hypothetical protein [Ndongobacter massiliensis]
MTKDEKKLQEEEAAFRKRQQERLLRDLIGSLPGQAQQEGKAPMEAVTSVNRYEEEHRTHPYFRENYEVETDEYALPETDYERKKKQERLAREHAEWHEDDENAPMEGEEAFEREAFARDEHYREKETPSELSLVEDLRADLGRTDRKRVLQKAFLWHEIFTRRLI